MMAALQALVTFAMTFVPVHLHKDNLPLLKALATYAASGGFLEPNPCKKPMQTVRPLSQLKVRLPLMQKGMQFDELWCRSCI